ncbi:TPA: ATP-dependent DNA ligase [Candidatus Woesearchaeota archaeon]|nr:ATP-dependent DNA ligase [Candidatus Woesearchaeota archaeon]HIH31363.1 ATP-dependent DNA ligase [Candidatus Woesearchaeota archaeon]HIH54431.1 ATP-dependent DNA ligase [Candidatus Woesearchaeota archaeon]HIJ02370.1 ATP-dependent DNA ligase [Candidatus Woesearchaeota archaeon]HIJ14152.1 ATP-dependent DNA ligase [Candidatus Woesearchaeota archaeon]
MQYSELAGLYEKLEATSKRLEKTKILADFLKECSAKDVDKIILMVQGLVFPKFEENKIGIASKLVVKALNTATGISSPDIEKSWKKTGDLGLTAEELMKRKRQHTLFSESLSVDKVYKNIRKLAEIEGTGSTDVKMKTISELLTSAKPLETRYIVRLLLEDLRVGLGEGTLRDAIALAYFERKEKKDIDIQNAQGLFGKASELSEIRDKIQQAYDVTNDYAAVAGILMDKGIDYLKKLQLDVFKPVKVMLAQKVKDIDEGFEKVGKPAALEYKYDGFRMLIGKEKDKITIHTRRLENVTKQFPDVVSLIKENVKTESCIIDCEAVGFDAKTKKYVPFQNISQRIKRKYDIDKMSKELPVELNVFDIIYYEGKSMIDEKFENRRKILEKIIKQKELKIRLAEQLITDNKDKAQRFYEKSLNAGNEGIMLKTLNAPYKPGSRVGFMVKLKPVMETLDLVIVAAEWGEGKRAGWLTSFTVACYDEDTDEFLEIGKFGTGIKEKEEEGTSFEELTKLLKPFIISEKGREVIIKPKIVVEIKFEEIQKSPSYSSGYALRFPRLVRIREDRRPDESSALSQIQGMYKEQ